MFGGGWATAADLARRQKNQPRGGRGRKEGPRFDPGASRAISSQFSPFVASLRTPNKVRGGPDHHDLVDDRVHLIE